MATAGSASQRVSSQTALLGAQNNPYGTGSLNTDSVDFRSQFLKPSLNLQNASYWGPLSTENLPEGCGLKHFVSNGASYFGMWSQGRRHGQGHYIVPNEEEYTGPWVDEKKEVLGGTQNNADGTIFAGEFKNDHYYKGTLTEEDGAFFKGLCDADGVFREGVHVNADGTKTVRYENGEAISSSGCCVIL